MSMPMMTSMWTWTRLLPHCQNSFALLLSVCFASRFVSFFFLSLAKFVTDFFIFFEIPLDLNLNSLHLTVEEFKMKWRPTTDDNQRMERFASVRNETKRLTNSLARSLSN